MSFRNDKTLEERKTESRKIITKYPEKIPVIIECKDNIQIDKKKFLAHKDHTIGQFLHIIRKRIKCNEGEGLFYFINNKIPLSSESMVEVYKKNCDGDGFLYIDIIVENTFGNTFK